MKPKNSLNVSEMFYSIQGEGRYAGTPSFFLRLQHCNLLCRWCDTIEIWKRGNPYNTSELIDIWKEKGWITKLQSKKAHLVITGGEPLLQQSNLEDLLKCLGDIFVEIETNGTITPTKGFDEFINQYNVSPKLANSGMSMNKRYYPEVIECFSKKENADFKFVIVSYEDVKELIDSFITRFEIPNSRIYLMPESTTKEELEKRSPLIIEICKEYGFRYSSRLQLSIWDKVTGI